MMPTETMPRREFLERLRALAVQVWPIGRLLPYERNARTHSDEQMAQMAASIVEFGWTNPILVTKRHHHRGPRAPGGCPQAANGRGTGHRPGPPDRGATARAGAGGQQNRASTPAGTRKCSGSSWRRCRRTGFNLDLVGFSDDELEALLADPEKTGEGSPKRSVRLQEKVVTVPRRRVDDGRSPPLVRRRHADADVEKVLAGGLADMVFTRPAIQRATTRARPPRNSRSTTTLSAANFTSSCATPAANMLAVTKGAMYICMSSSELHTLFQAFTDAGGHWSTFVIWAKHHFTLGRSDYQRHVRADPVRLARRDGPLLVRRARSGRRVVHQAAHGESGTPDHEAGRTRRARDPEQQQDARHDPGSVRRLRNDIDRLPEVRPSGAR